MITITDKGFLTLPVTAKKHGLAKFGVPQGGPADAFRYLLANRLAGNTDDAWALEATLRIPGIRFDDPRAVAVVGDAALFILRGGKKLRINANETVFVELGDELLACSLAAGMRAYIAVSGGLADSGFRPVPVRNGEAIHLEKTVPVQAARIKDLPLALPGDEVVLRVLPGVQSDHFSHEGREIFFGSEYTYTANSDRMGIRLSGVPVAFAEGQDGNIISEGMLPGDIQITSSGQPILMMADCPVSGGYAKIAHVIAADLPIAAQLRPGAKLRFREVDVASAHIALRRLTAAADGCIAQQRTGKTDAQ